MYIDTDSICLAQSAPIGDEQLMLKEGIASDPAKLAAWRSKKDSLISSGGERDNVYGLWKVRNHNPELHNHPLISDRATRSG